MTTSVNVDNLMSFRLSGLVIATVPTGPGLAAGQVGLLSRLRVITGSRQEEADRG